MNNKKLWIDTRLNEEEMNFLWDAISDPENEHENHNQALVGNIFRSELIEDKDNWFYESALKKLVEKMFYRDWDNFNKYHIGEERPLPEFKMEKFWVNYMKQHEFNPLPHVHFGLYSFVVFMKIPTHWKEQHALPFSAHSNKPCASDFQFMWTQKDSEESVFKNFSLSPADEGRMLFFPASLQHQVYPFYGTEEERVTISGNIILKGRVPMGQEIPVIPANVQEISINEYEGKEKILKLLEESVRTTKNELKRMKIIENV